MLKATQHVREPDGTARPSGMKFKSLSSLREPKDLAEAAPRRLSVCVVTSELLGPTKNGGIGTATSALVDRLAETGHRVTVLFTQVWGGKALCQDGTWDHWVAELRSRGIRLTAIKHQGAWNAWREKAWAVKSHLENQSFDLVYFNEHHANGFYALMAKRAGLAPFVDQFYAVITHGSMEWVARTNDQPPTHPNDVAMAMMERRCVEWADAVIGPSAYLLNTYRSYGWHLPAQTYVQPYLLGSTKNEAPPSKAIDELVFFGRLEHRKGLWMFCQALDRLAEQGLRPRVTFLGRMTPVGDVPSGALLLARAANWPFTIKLITNYGQDDALSYLQKPGRLAVMPSLADNSPCVVYECIERSLPFVTCSTSGADEIIASGDHKTVLAEPTATALADRLADCLANGASTARIAFDPDKNVAAWDRWHRRISARKQDGIDARPAPIPVGRRGNEARRAIVLLDEPGHGLGPLFESLADNTRRLSNNCDLLFATPRGGLLEPWIEQMLALIASTAGGRIKLVGPGKIQETISDYDCIVVAPASARLLPPTIDRCASLIESKPGLLVSCLPTGRSDNPIVQFHSLPHGDIADLGAFDERLTGSICVSDRKTATDLLVQTLMAATEQGDWPPPYAVCEELASRHLAAGGRFSLVPQVGMTVGNEKANRSRPIWHRQAKLTAALLGFDPTDAESLPSWMAMSSSWANRASRSGSADDDTASGGTGDLAMAAASSGRYSLAVDFAAMGSPTELERVRQTAIQTIRSVEPVDFLPQVLTAAAGRNTNQLSQLATSSSSLTVLFGSTEPATDLIVREKSLALSFAKRIESQAMLVAFDLAFAGHQYLTVGFDTNVSGEAKASTVEIALVDQATGELLCPIDGPRPISKDKEVSIFIGGVSVNTTLMLTFSSMAIDDPASCIITSIRAR